MFRPYRGEISEEDRGGEGVASSVSDAVAGVGVGGAMEEDVVLHLPRRVLNRGVHGGRVGLRQAPDQGLTLVHSSAQRQHCMSVGFFT